MSLRFPYLSAPTGYPVVPLKGRPERPRPVVSVTLIGPRGSVPRDALLDTGSDDTVFPDSIAQLIGVDLANAPTGQGLGIGGTGVSLRYAEVLIRIADNNEQREWRAWVGFTPAPSRYALLGFAGFLQYFTAVFHGELEEVELTVNSLYSGT